MAWNPIGINIIATGTNGSIFAQILTSLAKELERMQREIDELKQQSSRGKK
jgi:hypothetical protein